MGAVEEDDVLGAKAGNAVAADEQRPVDADEAMAVELLFDRSKRCAVNDGSRMGVKLDVIARGADPIDLARKQGEGPVAIRSESLRPAEAERHGSDSSEGRHTAPCLERQVRDSKEQRANRKGGRESSHEGQECKRQRARPLGRLKGSDPGKYVGNRPSERVRELLVTSGQRGIPHAINRDSSGDPGAGDSQLTHRQRIADKREGHRQLARPAPVAKIVGSAPLAAGFGAVTGVDVTFARHLGIGLQGRYDLTSGVRYGSLRAVGTYYIDTAPGRTGVGQ